MTKLHILNLAEQIASKGHGSSPFHFEKSFNQRSSWSRLEDVSRSQDEDNSSIKLRAYQIHLEKGGSDLDNWLEAEQSLKNIDQSISRLISEGNPNT